MAQAQPHDVPEPGDPPGVLIHVGLHKCGSTWLQENVFARADLGFAAPWGSMAHRAVTEFVASDPLAFDAEAVRRDFMDAARAAGAGVAVLSHEALSSRPHHGRYYAPSVAERLKRAFPEARVLLIFREQSRIIYSLYGEHVRNGGRHTLTEFVGTGDEPPGWAPLCQLSFFEYDRLVRMYRDVFGADRVLALPLELLKAEPALFADRLLRFAGRPAAALDTGRRSNHGWRPTTVGLYRWSNGIVRANPIGPRNSWAFRQRNRLAWRLDRLVPKSRDAATERRLRRTIADRIGTRYHAANARLARLVDLDLAGLGYPCEPAPEPHTAPSMET